MDRKSSSLDRFVAVSTHFSVQEGSRSKRRFNDVVDKQSRYFSSVQLRHSTTAYDIHFHFSAIGAINRRTTNRVRTIFCELFGRRSTISAR